MTAVAPELPALDLTDADPYSLGETPAVTRVAPPPREPVVGELIMMRNTLGEWFEAGNFHSLDPVDGSPITKMETVWTQGGRGIPLGPIHFLPPKGGTLIAPKGMEVITHPTSPPFVGEEGDLAVVGCEGWNPAVKNREPVVTVVYLAHRGCGYGPSGWLYPHDVPTARVTDA